MKAAAGEARGALQRQVGRIERTPAGRRLQQLHLWPAPLVALCVHCFRRADGV